VEDPVSDLVGAFFVGPGKCGTSWLFEACRAHPDVDVGRIKEPGEFLRESPEIATYERLWQGPGIRCDFSNTYFFSETAAEGIRRYNPSARICITVRDPLARLVSQYMFMRRNGRFDGTIREAIVAEPHIVDRCRFASHGERWLTRFEPSRTLVLRLETLESDPEGYRRALFGFLGVADRADVAPARQAQSAALPRSRLLARGIKDLAGAARGARMFRVIDWAKRSGFARMLYRPLPRGYQQKHLEDIPAGVRTELAEEYGRFLAMALRLPGLRIV